MRMFVHREQYGRFVSCLVFLPRDRYNTPVRVRIADLLLDEFGATSYEWNTYLSASVLARLHFVLRVDPLVTPDIDLAALEARVAAAARVPGPTISATRSISARGEEEGLDLFRVWSNAFPASYQENIPGRGGRRRPHGAARARRARRRRRCRSGSTATPSTSTSSSTASAPSRRSPT